MVTAINICWKSRTLYTGDINGLVASWSLNKVITQGKKFPRNCFIDHLKPVISIDSNYALDMNVTTSEDECVIRISSTQEYYKRITPKLLFNTVPYKIFAVFLSERGYAILHLRCGYAKYGSDIFIVYSIDGELICYKEMCEIINSVVFDRTQYFIVIH